MIGNDEEIGGCAKYCVGIGEEARVTCPCGQMSGSAVTISYSSRATLRVAGSEEKKRSGFMSARQPAAIHRDDRAVHVIGCRGGEEYDSALEVIGCTPAPGRDTIEN